MPKGCPSTEGIFFSLLPNTPKGYYIVAMEMKEENQNSKKCPSCDKCRIKHREPKEVRQMMSRLNRIEGQIKGIKGMLEKDAYCPNILIQVSAVNAALNSFNKVLLASHIKTCVAKHVREGDESVIEELVQTLQKLMK